MSEKTVTTSRRGVQVRWTPRLIIALVLLFLALVFALQNFDHVDVNILFWDFSMRLVWALMIFALIGAVLGWMLPKFRSRR